MTARIKKYLVVLFMTLLSLNLQALPNELKLRVMETTDVHTNIMNYDYYKGEDLETVGLIRTSTLIKNARSEAKNTFLVDNGDLIQGTPLGTYKATIEPLKKRLRRLVNTSLEPISLTTLFILDLGTSFPCLALLFRGITSQLYCLKLHWHRG